MSKSSLEGIKRMPDSKENLDEKDFYINEDVICFLGIEGFEEMSPKMGYFMHKLTSSYVVYISRKSISVNCTGSGRFPSKIFNFNEYENFAMAYNAVVNYIIFNLIE